MRLTGTWEGEYVYGPNYAIEGLAVPFRMSLQESWLRKVVGSVRDDASAGGQPELGRIEGRRRGRHFEFVKAMPVAYAMDPETSELVPTMDFLARAAGREPPGSQLSSVIRYSGTYDPVTDSLEGRWSIVPHRFPSAAGPIEWGGGSGTWTARRLSRELSEV